ncbi:hypothetical protein A3732_08805, partial [Oleiphilus sp. HI0050]
MIVFTATNRVNNEVYVGSARDSMEEHWARLIVQAEEGGSGEFLDTVREFGVDNFTVETWAYADSPAESRELVRDACDEFNGKLIKTGRAPAPTVNKVNQEVHSEPKAIQEAKATSKVTSIHKQSPAAKAASNTPEDKSSISQNRSTKKEHGPVTSIDVKAYLAAQAETVKKEEKKAEVVELRKSDSTKDFDDMKAVMMNIEMKRRQNRAGSSTKTSAPKTKTSTASKTSNTRLKTNKAKTSPAKDKLPEGRVGSAAKEKRIKEAIAKEKMEREAAQAAKAAAEAKEMAEI